MSPKINFNKESLEFPTHNYNFVVAFIQSFQLPLSIFLLVTWRKWRSLINVSIDREHLVDLRLPHPTCLLVC